MSSNETLALMVFFVCGIITISVICVCCYFTDKVRYKYLEATEFEDEEDEYFTDKVRYKYQKATEFEDEEDENDEEEA